MTRSTYRARRATDMLHIEAAQRAASRWYASALLFGVIVLIATLASCAPRQPYGEDLWKGLKHVHQQ